MPRPTGAAQVVHSSGPMYLRDGLRPYAPRGTRDGTPSISLLSIKRSKPMPRGGRGTARRVVLPYGWLRRAAAIARASGAQRSVCASGCEEMSGNCGRDHPQRGHQPRTIPQSPSGRQLPLHKGAFGDGGCGLPRRFAPRNDSPDSLPFRGGPTGRRGNPSFFRWTGVRAAEVVGPYGRSTEVPATGRCGHRPLRNEVGSCRDCRGSALSAERVAGQSQSLPDDLRVQHGVLGSEVSARPRPCSRRDCDN